jgi:hypothetical protein
MDEPVAADITGAFEQAVPDRLVEKRKALRAGFVERRRDERE